MKFDDLLTKLGHFGRYQKWIFSLIVLPIVFTGIQIMSPVFTLATPKFRCAVPGLDNDTYLIQDEIHRQLVISWIPKYDDVSENAGKCNVYTTPLISSNSTNITSETTACSKWVYDKSVFENTVITETDLVCSRTIYRAHATTALNMGSLLGYLTLGSLADRFGRKKTYLIEIVMMTFASCVLTWLPSIYFFIFIRALIGISFGVFYNTSFVYSLEFVGPSKRTLMGMLVNHVWALGLFIQAGLAYGLPQWRHLQLATSLPLVLFLSYWWLVPESPRWLVSSGRKKEAEVVILRMAKVNKVSISPEDLQSLKNEGEAEGEQTSKVNILHMFKYKELSLRCIVLFINWLVVSLLYYGLSLNVGNLYGNIYVNFTLSAVMEVVGYTVAIPLIAKIGRKRFHCTSMLVGGVSLLITIFPVVFGGESLRWLVVTLSMIGKLSSSAAYGTIYLFSTELHPTVVRSAAMGLSALFAGLGGIIAPYIVETANLLDGAISRVVPLLVFGISTLIAGLLALTLPDTSKIKLPETIQDARELTWKTTQRKYKVHIQREMMSS